MTATTEPNPFIEHPAIYRPADETGRNRQWLFRFANGYGASVVQGPYTYGGAAGLWELAVIIYDAVGGWEITYATPVTDDVLGYQTVEEIRAALLAVAELPS